MTSPINIDLLTSNGRIITETIIDNFQVVLEKNNYLEIFFSWQNGCNIGISDYYSFSIISRGLEGNITAPLEYPNGNYFLDLPSCNDQKLSNSLEIIKVNVNSNK